ncbi:MAG TPA: long-chain fatty acid--CoA ligase [Thermoanaerobaculia bacterium]|nr:long-chain fatty acid--CoA ligase [Thermoanaerobaculia bacterium]
MTPRTLVDIFRNLADTPKPDLLLSKQGGKWIPISTAEFMDRVKALSSALADLGVKQGGRVALLSENRPEWAIVDFACQCYGAVLVPIFPTMVAEQAAYLLKDSGATVAFASTSDQATKILGAQQASPEVKQTLKHVIVFDASSQPGTTAYATVVEKGRAAHAADPSAFEKRADARQPSDLATLIYTSGTTGEPKGAMLMQSNFVSNVLAGCSILPFDSSAVGLSFLPLSHVFERMLEYCFYHRAATIAYAESIDKLRDNLSEVNPHIFGAVPRVYEKVYGRVQENLSKSSPAKRKLFEKAVEVGRKVTELRARKETPGFALALQHFLYERLVYRKVRAALGSRFRFAVSGGAPLAKELAEFFWAVGVEVYEGYGLTETSPVIAVASPAAWRLGTVGKILPGVECRIAADGEILTRGPHIMKGYFNKPKETAEAIDAEGWFHTGDIGRIDQDGFLMITDRKKEILVNSNGKNVAPAPIEGHLKSHPFVSLPVLIGDRRKYLSCLFVPNFEKLSDWAKTNGLGSLSTEDLVKEPRVVAIFQSAIDEWNAGKSHELLINRFAILPRDLTIESGELTPTLKVKRRIVDQHFKHLIDAMYQGSAA